jgi:hypothetical protein
MAAQSYLQQYLSQQQTGGVDPTKVNEAVAAARAAGKVPDQTATIQKAYSAVKKAEKARTPSILSGVYTAKPWPEGDVARAAIANFAGQVQAAQKQADVRGEALQLKSEATQSYVAGLDALGTVVAGQLAEATAAWNKLTATSDQYVKDTAAHMAQVTGDIKATIEKYAATNDAALAHSIQSSSYAWLQTAKDTERGIAERYGTNSAEYRAFQESKRASIGAMVSDLTAKSWEKTQQILNTGLGALTQVADTGMTQLGWAQKNDLDALTAAAQAGESFRLNTTSYLMTLEAAKNTAWGELADWIDKSTVMSVDATPLFSLLLELQQTQPAQAGAGQSYAGLASGGMYA